MTTFPSLVLIAALLSASTPMAVQVRGDARILGKVVDEAGQPLADVAIKATKKGETQSVDGKSNNKGEFAIAQLATGEWKAAYCLTEPDSGSDANSGKTKAALTSDGKHYILNGQKMWITNAGFADVFIVFAQVDGDKFTGFIVERNTPGLTLGHEEHKMGIKGSSTRQVFFSDCKVPKENVLGEIGKGHLIAFNILNLRRTLDYNNNVDFPVFGVPNPNFGTPTSANVAGQQFQRPFQLRLGVRYAF